MNDFSQYRGLSSEEAEKRLRIYGKNELSISQRNCPLRKLLKVLKEPMFLLLLITAALYFFLGKPQDGGTMLIFVGGMITIDSIQEWKTDRTLSALRELSAPQIPVIRDEKEQKISSCDLVPGDRMLLFEGDKIPADGRILECSDFMTDESTLTGETEAISKVPFSENDFSEFYFRRDSCYAGTLVTRGSAAVFVERTGHFTEYGKIGTAISQAPEKPTPLQSQTVKLIKSCAILTMGLFVLVTLLTFWNLSAFSLRERLTESLLSGITLSMAMIPEEFPVVLTVFLSMGAWRLAKKHALVRKLSSVETLGAVSVLCVDKTGTLTKNEMKVTTLWPVNINQSYLAEIMGLGCETPPYDPMEKAMLRFCREQNILVDSSFRGEFLAEYSLTDDLKIMGHVWKRNGHIEIALKGSPEQILKLCQPPQATFESARKKYEALSRSGLRVIAAAIQILEESEPVPKTILECHPQFAGLIGLCDPPRESIKQDIENCRRAGIRVLMITGDSPLTACAIAQKVGIQSTNHAITGAMLDQMDETKLLEAVKTSSVFARTIPSHKMRIIEALRKNGEVVAMTGDGVNDAPALKYADIGISMGKKGNQVSREAADLILMDDRFSTIVETIHDGRRIYENIRKAVSYIFTIHIPIALSAIFMPILRILPDSLFLLPVHIMLLELLIDPTCSLVLERMPAQPDLMKQSPRKRESSLLSHHLLGKSFLQGFVLFLVSFGFYVFCLDHLHENAAFARSMGLCILMTANFFLVLLSAFDRGWTFRGMQSFLRDRVIQFSAFGTFLLIFLMLNSPFCTFLKLSPLSISQFFVCVFFAAISVFWYEPIKHLSH